MTSANERSQRVAASFTRAYYTALLQKPEMLSVFYTVDATFEHLGCKAQGSTDIQSAVNNLYIPRPEAEVKISSIATTLTGDHAIFATIKGTMLSAATTTNANVTFTHEVELMEYAEHPGSFGIVSDRREEAAAPAVREEAPARWAYETPPMFAQEPGPDVMEPIEQPPAATAEGLAADETAPAESPAAPSAEGALTGAEGAQPAADLVQAEPAAEEKRPRSFAEAIKMSKRSTGPAATLTVVAKDTAALAPQVPAAQPRERRDAAAAAAATAAERDAKAPHKDAAQGNGRRAAANNNDGGERRNGVANANANGNAAKPKKDAEGRALSRTVVFFDIIVKGLPANATKQYVQDLVQPSAPVKEIKIVSQADKKDPSVVRTFAFAQLDHEAIKESGGDVKAKIAMIIDANKTRKGPNGQRIQVDEVREKYTAAPVTASTEATTA